MTALGVMLWVFCTWALLAPKAFGRWIGTIILHAKSVEMPSPNSHGDER